MAVMCASICTSAFAQGGAVTGSLSGLVVDKDGGVIPGATVEIKNNATSEKTMLVTNSAGVFTAPALNAGTYTVTVSLQGFKTAVTESVRLLSAQASSIAKITLQVGALTETVKVTASSELIHTQETTVSNTITADQIKNLPVVSRNALSFVIFLPNVQTPGTARASTIAGLPQSAINISIDGVTTSNLLQSGDGFFSMVTPRLDAVEEVTLSIAGESADSSAQGAVQIKFVTRSGTNMYTGTGYFYGRDPRLNTNYHFNKIAFDNATQSIRPLPKNDVKVHQYGGSEGGPIVIPRIFDGRGKAFFFHNTEIFHQPNQLNRTRTVLTESARAGILTYSTCVAFAGGNCSDTNPGTTTVRTIDLFAAATTFANANPTLQARVLAANVADPTIGSILSRIRQSTTTQGVINSNTGTSAASRSTEAYIWQPRSLNTQTSPTTKIDINLSTRNRLSGSYWAQRYHSTPDLLNSVEPRFPGFVNQASQNSWRTFGSAQLRTTLGQGMVNTIQGGWQTSPNDFFSNIQSEGGHFDDQTPAGAPFPISLGFPLVDGATTTRNFQPRNTPNWNLNDDFSWLRGSHSLTFGGSFTQTINTQNSQDVAHSVSLGLDTTNDPAAGLFAPANFPGITSSNDNTLGTARSLYALLTGRITSLTCTARLNDAGTDYVYCGNLKQRAKASEVGAYAQDSWRVKPNLTVNAGVRWDVMLPFTPITGNYSMTTLADACGVSGFAPVGRVDNRQCNLFQPNVIYNPNIAMAYQQYNPGSPGYDTKWTKFAPNFGLAWRPNVQNGILRTLLGDPEQALVRGTFGVSFNQPRMDAFTGTFGGNPGGTLATGATRGTGSTNFPLYTGPGGLASAPLLLNQPTLLGPAPFNPTLSYPIQAVRGGSLNLFDPNITTPFVKTWSIGVQRAVGRDMAIELRYTGNRAEGGWVTENWNQFNIYENGFLTEFKSAMGNLQANVAAGRGENFRYFGPGTGTSPLPTYMAAFGGASTTTGCGDASGRCPNASDPTKYGSNLWTSTTFTGQMDQWFPNPRGAASSLWTSTSNNVPLRDNMAAAGVPANYFVMNPGVSAVNVRRNGARSYYHGTTINVQRRLSQGLTAGINYTYALQGSDTSQDLHFERLFFRTASVPHAIKFNYDYQIPVGRGRRFGTNFNRWIDGALGGWQWSGTGRVQWREFQFEGILHNMTVQDLKKGFHVRKTVDPVTGQIRYFDMDQDIIDNSDKAFDTSATSLTGYGSNGGPDPNSRYLGPAGGPSCFYLYRGDCGEQQYFIRGFAFARYDMTIKKRFEVGKKVYFTVQYDLLNAFDSINFNPNFDPGGSWQVTSAYTDANGTFDPGGRVGQIVFRVNW